jgi:3'-phosphoadenosine 5'-phosphosulfate sulfotransferase (PAPS reductase)/FAD synthetase
MCEHTPAKRFVLFSGGNDSIVALDLLAHMADAIVHINTGIGIKEAHDFAREHAGRYDLPYIELRPPVAYRDLVLGVWGGFPGPGAHRFAFIRLKERCIEQLLRDHRTHNGQRFLLLTGARRAESKRRMGHGQEIRRKGGQVWTNPLWSWSNGEMARYRLLRDLPQNPVAAHLHMSGECMCGAMADQDQNRAERAAVKFFFPDFERELCELEAECRAAGLRYCEWGVKRPDTVRMFDPNALSLFDDDPDWMPLCASCEGRRL